MGTGNYNEKTARIYTDFGLMTADRAIGEDASAFFNALTGFSDPPRMKKLSMAPTTLRERFVRLIQREQRRAEEGQPAEIRAKMNSLVDEEMIRALYDASKAGVKIRLNVRGICCLRPGVKGVSETIDVISVVDRFLEHSRVFHFRNGGEDEVYLASADWMPRNLDRRIELLFPVAPENRQEGAGRARRDVPGQRQGPPPAVGRDLPAPQEPARRRGLPGPGPPLQADAAGAREGASGGRGHPGAHEPGRRRRHR
jgi:polyphosphate kinase